MDDLLADFLTETRDGLLTLDALLVRLEREPGDAATIGEVFRAVHTIKGTCGFLGLSRLERVAHAAENVLGRYRDGSLEVTEGGISLILRAIDAMRAIVVVLEGGGSEPAGDDAALIAALDAASAGEAPDAAPTVPTAPVPAAAAPPVVEPAAEVSVPAEPMAASPAATAPPAAAAPAPAADTGGAGQAPQTIRVAVDVLESLMVLVSELVLTRNQLLQTARGRADDGFAAPLQRLSQITSELQEGVMKTRMQPIGNAWAKLPRLVRDLAVELGKKIELEMRGAETELDRQVLELIKDPLTHMVRNSGDHGLETTADRRRAGKPETGRILLEARHEGGHIVIDLADDGRGLDTARIKQKVLAQGLATETELAGMSEREIHRFIFRAGFSTAAAVTAVSGRGVGMDVVKTNMERIGGTIEVRSIAGRGTAFEIKIPLTLAIVSGLIVEAGGERFAIPQLGVVELVRLGGTYRRERIKDVPVLRLRDRLLPLVSLGALLRLDPRADAEVGAEEFVVVMQVGAQVFGIVVDRVFDTEEIVVKPVAPILRHLTLFSGNTILGDGSVIMILDPSGIARATGMLGGEGADRPRAGGAVAVTRSDAPTPLLLFRAGEGGPKAVPLALISRLETIAREHIEQAAGQPVVQYRGRLMPLVPIGQGEATGAAQPVLVFDDAGRAMGLMVDEILDVMDAVLDVDRAGEHPGFLGSAVIAGKVTEILDTAWWLARAHGDWFGPAPAAAATGRILVVEDSAFFRNLAVPALTASGHKVTAVGSAREALALREGGQAFDAIISDIEMPDMDGLAFAAAVREGGAWRDLPLIALSGLTAPHEVARGRAAGFTDYVAKFDREALMESLRTCLAAPVG